MKIFGRRAIGLFWGLMVGWAALAREPQPAPPAVRLSPGLAEAPRAKRMEASVPPAVWKEWAMGDPTSEEQMYLEYVNRARAFPWEEGYLLAISTDPDLQSAYRFFGVDLQRVVDEIALFPPQPPLAFEPRLIEVARFHSRYMLANAIQEHDQHDPVTGAQVNTTASRLIGTGYPLNAGGESVYAYSESPLHGHASFEVDWGFGDGGVQRPPGHRISNHDGAFREIGVGVVHGTRSRVIAPVTNLVVTQVTVTNLVSTNLVVTNLTLTNLVVTPATTNTVGPTVVTLDFASRADLPPLVTGVVYYDFNTNGFYDVDEGVAGVRVEDAASGWFAVTGRSGGYAVPGVEGTQTLRFLAADREVGSRSVTVLAGRNVKQDCQLPHGGTRVSGPSAGSSTGLNVFRLDQVLGAGGYECFSMRWDPFGAAEGGESGLGRLEFSGLPGWDPVKTGNAASGSRSFQLVHTNGLDQVLRFRPVLRPGPGGEVRFRSFIGYTTTNQIASVEVSTNGTDWIPVLQERGRGISVTPSGGWVARAASLAPWAGREISLRLRFFVEPVQGAQFYTQTQASFGWFVDELLCLDAQVGTEPSTTTLAPGEPLVFRGASGGRYELRARPRFGGIALPLSAPLVVDFSPTAAASGTVVVEEIRRGPAGRLLVDFALVSGAVREWVLEARNTLSGPWQVAPGGTISDRGAGRLTWDLPAPETDRFLRVTAR
jgi:hypothetical protein